MNTGLIIGILIILLIAIFILENPIVDDKDGEEIKYYLIPRLTRTVISIDSIDGSFCSNIGDIIETHCEIDGKRRYYIHSYCGICKLTYKQVKRLEGDYNIRIII